MISTLFRQAVRLLRTIPGVSDLTAQVIISEIGTDMSRFPTAGHLISWAGARKKANYLQGQFQRLRHRRGAKQAFCAVAASILTAAYHMLRDGSFYQDLGFNHFRRATPKEPENRLVRQIAKLGFIRSFAQTSIEEVSV